MSRQLMVIILALFFFIIGTSILLEQYLNIGVWFQLSDVHHETFALTSFGLAIGILIGSKVSEK